jgi:hypothetical protein
VDAFGRRIESHLGARGNPAADDHFGLADFLPEGRRSRRSVR